MLVPAMLPTASPPLPSAAAVKPTASSGVLVPSATTVSPRIIGDTPNKAPTRDPPRTMSSAPTMTTMSPAIKEVMATRCMRSIMGGGTGRPRDHAPRAIGIWQVAQLLGKDNASNRASARS